MKPDLCESIQFYGAASRPTQGYSHIFLVLVSRESSHPISGFLNVGKTWSETAGLQMAGVRASLMTVLYIWHGSLKVLTYIPASKHRVNSPCCSHRLFFVLGCFCTNLIQEKDLRRSFSPTLCLPIFVASNQSNSFGTRTR